MKRIFLMAAICCCAAAAVAENYDFGEPNADGDSLFYKIIDENTVRFLENHLFPKEEWYYIDTLRLPETVTHEQITYTVDYSGKEPYMLYNSTRACPKIVYLPKTFHYTLYILSPTVVVWPPDDNDTRFEGWIVDAENPYYSAEGGVLFSKDKTTLVAFPIYRRGTYNVPNTVTCLGQWSFFSTHLDTLNVPNSVTDFQDYFIWQAANMTTFRFPDSMTRLTKWVDLYGKKLREIIFGSGLSYVETYDLGRGENMKQITCLAVTPPEVEHSNLVGVDTLTLAVPRKSIPLYQQAPGWSRFRQIIPVEPPVVAGVNTAEVAWVTNADANGYSLTLYSDEQQSQRLLTLSFDRMGYVTGIDIGTGILQAPAVPHRVVSADAEGSSEEQYVPSCLSYTFTGLSAGRTYSFSRQTLDVDGEVIDEESVSFRTLPDPTTALPDVVQDNQPGKILRNGQVYILHNGKQYLLNGTEMK